MDRQKCADVAMMFMHHYHGAPYGHRRAQHGGAAHHAAAQPTVEHVEVRASNADEANRIRDQLQHDRSAPAPAPDAARDDLPSKRLDWRRPASRARGPAEPTGPARCLEAGIAGCQAASPHHHGRRVLAAEDPNSELAAASARIAELEGGLHRAERANAALRRRNLAISEVRETRSWPRSWANFSLL